MSLSATEVCLNKGQTGVHKLLLQEQVISFEMMTHQAPEHEEGKTGSRLTM